MAADRRAGGEDGSAAIEFAIVAPVVILLILSLFEGGFLMAGGLLLEAGGRAASRYGLTGETRGQQTRDEIIREIVTRHVCPTAAGGGGYCMWSARTTGRSPDGVVSPLLITPRAYKDPGNVGKPEPFADTSPANGVRDPGEPFTDVNGNGQWDADMARIGPGGSGDVVVYELAMPQDVQTPLLRAAFGESVIFHAARFVIANEAF